LDTCELHLAKNQYNKVRRTRANNWKEIKCPKTYTVFPDIVAAATILFLEVGVRQVFKGGNYSKEETIVFLILSVYHKK
jgi:hypothetical protein